MSKARKNLRQEKFKPGDKVSILTFGKLGRMKAPAKGEVVGYGAYSSLGDDVYRVLVKGKTVSIHSSWMEKIRKNPGKAYHLKKAKDWREMKRGTKEPELISIYGALAEDDMFDARRSKHLGIPNPGAKWHIARADELRVERRRYSRIPGQQWDYLNERVKENDRSAGESWKRGMKNPTRRKTAKRPSIATPSIGLIGVIALVGYLVYRNR